MTYDDFVWDFLTSPLGIAVGLWYLEWGLFICGHRRVAVARYRMICLVLISLMCVLLITWRMGCGEWEVWPVKRKNTPVWYLWHSNLASYVGSQKLRDQNSWRPRVVTLLVMDNLLDTGVVSYDWTFSPSKSRAWDV